MKPPRDIEARIQATTQMLMASLRASDVFITADGRVGESEVAQLLGLSSDHLAEKRREGSGPRSYRIGGSGHRVTYRIGDIAEWIEVHLIEAHPAE